jgi:hypothetical protein
MASSLDYFLECVFLKGVLTKFSWKKTLGASRWPRCKNWAIFNALRMENFELIRGVGQSVSI